jgi:hypothetical protein
MKACHYIIILVSIFFVFSCKKDEPEIIPNTVDITGKWNGSAYFEIYPGNLRFFCNQNNENITGDFQFFSSSETINGKISGNVRNNKIKLILNGYSGEATIIGDSLFYTVYNPEVPGFAYSTGKLKKQIYKEDSIRNVGSDLRAMGIYEEGNLLFVVDNNSGSLLVYDCTNNMLIKNISSIGKNIKKLRLCFRIM